MFSDDYGLDMDGRTLMSPHDRGKLSANLK